MATVGMVAPGIGVTQFIGRSGTLYVTDGFGFVNINVGRDVTDALNAGFTLLNSASFIGRLIGANMNVTTDQPFTMYISTSVKFRISKITCHNASVSLTTAAGGVYPAASKGGTAIVAAGQAYSALTTNALALDLTLAAATTVYAAGTIPILSLTTGQGAAATADFHLYGDAYV